MKQSTKLLSLLLALVMAFSCMTVVGSALKADVTKDKLQYDAVDDAIISAEQGATIILNYLDAQVMPGLGTMDLSVLGTLDLTSVDNAFASIYALLGNGLLNTAATILMVDDVKDLMKNRNLLNVNRGGGDLNMVYALLNFLGSTEVVRVVKKAPKGLLTKDGITLGSTLNGIVEGLVDLGSVNEILTDIPGFATRAVFDLLIYGSYGYPDDAEELNNDLPDEVDNIDEILSQAIAGLLANPQDYEWVGEGEAAVKEWDMSSKVMPTISALGVSTVKSLFSVADGSNSIFALIDKLAPYAIYDLGVQPLNNNLKKALMEAVEADVNEISLDKVPADAQANFEVEKEDGKESYVTYISYDKIFHSKEDGEWYYTTLGNKVTGQDEEGNDITEKTRVFYKVNMAAANEFAGVINWDWEITAPKPYVENGAVKTKGTGAINEIDYTAIIGKYGSIAQSLNHLVYIVFNNALTNEVKEDFEATTGATWLDGATSADAGNGKTVFIDNLERLLKYLLANYANKIFGEDSEYVDWEYSDVANMTIVELAAHIGPTFFEDVMPQLIIPKNNEGRAAFHDGVQILEFGALVIREFMTEIAPQINYDGVIFAANTLTSATGRQFAVHTADQWTNIILNMGMDIAITYLTNLTNFSDFCKVEFADNNFDVAQWAIDNDGTSNPDYVMGADRWKIILDTAILWAVNYVGNAEKTGGVLEGINYTSVKAVTGPLNKLSFILNKILPLGFVNGCTSVAGQTVYADGTTATTGYDLDMQMVLDRIVDLAQNFNLDAIVGLFGRNTLSSYNLFNTAPLVKGVLDLANRILKLVLRTNLLPNTSSCAALLTNDNLSTIIGTLLTSLKNIAPELLTSALPAVCKLIKIFGGEQELGAPEIALSDTLEDARDESFVIANGTSGLWRGYKTSASATSHNRDNQYVFNISSVKAYNYNGSASSVITGIAVSDNTLDYAETANVTFKIGEVSSPGVIQKISVIYTVNDEDGNKLGGSDASYEIVKYVWISANGSNEGEEVKTGDDGRGVSWGYHKRYVDVTSMPGSANVGLVWFKREYQAAKGHTKIQMSGTADGATFSMPSTELNNGNREWKNISLYSAKTYQPGGDDADESTSQHTFTTTASFNQATFEALNRKAGGTGSININVSGKKLKLVGSGGDDFSGTINATFKYYDGEALSDLKSLVGRETDNDRVSSDYYTTGYSYADRILRSSDWNEDKLKETNSTTLVWIDADKKEYAESAVTKIENNYDDDDNLVSATGFVGDVAVKKVTKISNDNLWTAYRTALEAGIRGAWQIWNDASVFNHETLYNNLRIAVTELDFAKMPAVGGVDAAVVALEGTLDSIEAQYSDDKDYTDYRMYRWNRYNDAREEARDIVNAYYSAQRTADDVNKYFPYASIYPSELAKLVAGDKYANYINALLEDFDAETAARNAKDLENAKNHYANYTTLDVAQAKNLITRMAPRLLVRDHGVIDTHLRNEVASAKAMITNASFYTERSWVKYEKALADAEALLEDSGKTQMEIFDAKWELLTCRNELVYVEDEADYSELEALIAQAETALANAKLYNNTNKEFGQVLAELGYHDFDGTQLFYGSALWTNAEPYDYNDQDIVDDAADALKEALARLKFIGLSIKDADGNENTSTGILSTDDPETEEIEETITTTIAKIAAEMDADAVKDLFKVTANDVTVGKENITVSNDLYYTIDTDLPGFAGTNSVVTFYTVQGEVKIPVATVRIVVEADINGDGAVDVLDAAYENLVQTEKAKLEGCYLLAGDLAGDDRAITAADYAAVVNAVKNAA